MTILRISKEEKKREISSDEIALPWNENIFVRQIISQMESCKGNVFLGNQIFTKYLQRKLKCRAQFFVVKLLFDNF